LFAARGRVTGKLPHWVHFASQGHLWLFNRNKAGRAVAWVQGPTIGGFVRDMGRFPLIPLGEELEFCEAHRKNGGAVMNTSGGGCRCLPSEASGATWAGSRWALWGRS